MVPVNDKCALLFLQQKYRIVQFLYLYGPSKPVEKRSKNPKQNIHKPLEREKYY